jgi:hypothetical protein
MDDEISVLLWAVGVLVMFALALPIYLVLQ